MLESASQSTEKELARIRKRLLNMYGQASKELSEKAETYFEKFAAQDKKKRALVEAGKMSADDYRAWREQKVFVGERWRSMERQMAERLTFTDKAAMDYVNSRLPSVYTTNYNALARYTNGFGIGVRFDLLDEHTVKYLATTDKTLLPYKTVDGKKAERWHTQRVNAEVTQGILQGESMQEIAARLRKNVGMTAEGSAMRNARTAVGSAQNKGRLDMMLDMEKKGIITMKRWTCIHDARTRDAHAELDGVEKTLHEPFVNSIGEIDYPRSPDADPANVYNCRCEIVTHIMGVVNQETGEVTDLSGIQTFRNPPFPPKDTPNVSRRKVVPAAVAASKVYDNEISRSIGQENYQRYRERLDACENEDVRTIYETVQDTLGVDDSHYKGVAHHSAGALSWDVDKDMAGSSIDHPMGVFFHECGHGNDWYISRRLGYVGNFSESWDGGRFSRTIKSEVCSWVDSIDARLKAEFKAHKTDLEWLRAHGYVTQWGISRLESIANSAGVTVADVLAGRVRLESWEKSYMPKYSKDYAYAEVTREIQALFRQPNGKIAAGSLSDIVEGATKAKVQAGIGHGKVYWTGDARHYPHDVSVEAFAEISEAYVTNPESLALLRKYLPQSVSCFDEMMKYARGVL